MALQTVPNAGDLKSATQETSQTLVPPMFLNGGAVLGSNQWPLPCETGVWGPRINDMRGGFPVATGTWYHVTPSLSQNCSTRAKRFLSHLFRDTTTLEHIGQSARRALIELRYVAPQTLTP